MDSKTHFSRRTTACLQTAEKNHSDPLCYTVYEHRQACLYGADIKLIASYLINLYLEGGGMTIISF
jgi:hypothetical protein